MESGLLDGEVEERLKRNRGLKKKINKNPGK